MILQIPSQTVFDLGLIYRYDIKFVSYLFNKDGTARKIPLIKHFREITNVSLIEAKDAICALEDNPIFFNNITYKHVSIIMDYIGELAEFEMILTESPDISNKTLILKDQGLNVGKTYSILLELANSSYLSNRLLNKKELIVKSNLSEKEAIELSEYLFLSTGGIYEII